MGFRKPLDRRHVSDDGPAGYRASLVALHLFRTKQVEAIGESEGDPLGVGRLRKNLSARHLVAFGIGVVIGTGISRLRESSRERVGAGAA
jgi:amino acid permease